MKNWKNTFCLYGISQFTKQMLSNIKRDNLKGKGYGNIKGYGLTLDAI